MRILIISLSLFAHLACYSQQGLVCSGACINANTGTFLSVTGTNGNVYINNSGGNNGKLICSGEISFSGKIINNGSISFTGTTVIKGDNSTIDGSQTTRFNNLTISKSSDVKVITLNSNIEITGNLKFSKGDIYLNNKNINLGSTGIIVNESNNNKIYDNYINSTGTVTSSRSNLTPSSGEDFGNIGIVLTSDQFYGNTVVTRGHSRQSSIDPTEYSIYRYFIINTDNNSGLNTTMRIYYLQDEVPSEMSEATFAMYESSDNGITWSNINGSENATQNYIEKSGIDHFSRFTISDFASSPLPVSLSNFIVYKENNTAKLNWTTFTEINNRGFEIQKSTDLSNWKKIGFVEGAGNTNQENNYLFFDNLPDFEQIIYYRLKQVDYNDGFFYSEIRSVKTNSGACDFSVSVYPNPAKDKVNIYSSCPERSLTIKIFNNEGKLLSEITSASPASVDITNLSNGIYNTVIYEPESDKIVNKKLVVEN